MSPEEMKVMRKKHGLTQEEAASIAMVSRRQWVYWESGGVPMPRHRSVLFKNEVAKLKKKD